MDIFELLPLIKESKDAAVVLSMKNIEQWSRLRHTKEDLELLLTFNIVDIRFRPKNGKTYERRIVTSNKQLINVYKTVKEKDKTAKIHSNFSGIKTKDRASVMSYDLLDGKLKTINLESWEILDYMPISKENILVLDRIIRECLKKHNS